MDTFLASPYVFIALAFLATLIGASTLAARPAWALKQAATVSLVSAGLLIAFTMLDILPEALKSGHSAPAFALAGYLAGLLATLVGHRHRHQLTIDADSPVLIPLAGIAIHAFFDGVIYAMTSAGDTGSGWFTAGALSVHKVPVAALTFAMLLQEGYGRGPAFGITLLSVAGTAALGQFTAAPLLSVMGPGGVSALFALSAGLLLYVATGPLLAHGSGLPRLRGGLALGSGVALAALISTVVPHQHTPLTGPHVHDQASAGENTPPSFARWTAPDQP
jgi:ZIP family zinc transporter